MITVAVMINAKPILARSAVNVGGVDEALTQYKCDDGNVIWHKREDGALVLARKMLDLIDEEIAGGKKDEEEKEEQAEDSVDEGAE